jgi:uncharacterized protein (DUF1697 family)
MACTKRNRDIPKTWLKLSYTRPMANIQYLALLRGINVGGGNLIKMLDLKACFEASKLENVATYIQSGNVLFETAETDSVKLVGKLEKALSKTFSPYKAQVVLCSHAKLRQIVRKAPKGFGSQPQDYRYDVIFLKEPLTARAAMKSVSIKPGVDEAWVGPGVLYFSRLSARASQSRLTRVIALPIYQAMTIRNWNTTSKLLALMEARTQKLT